MAVTLSADTSPCVERMQIERLRQMPAWRKLALVGEMNQVVRQVACPEADGASEAEGAFVVSRLPDRRRSGTVDCETRGALQPSN